MMPSDFNPCRSEENTWQGWAESPPFKADCNMASDKSPIANTLQSKVRKIVS